MMLQLYSLVYNIISLAYAINSLLISNFHCCRTFGATYNYFTINKLNSTNISSVPYIVLASYMREHDCKTGNIKTSM